MANFVDLTASLGQKIRTENLRLVGETPGYSPGIDGREQVLYTENRVWMGSIGFPPVFGAELALLRSVPTRLRGRAGILRVPLLNVASPRFDGDLGAFWRSVGVARSVIAQGFVAFEDGATFDDGSGYALMGYSDETLADVLDVGATTITLKSFIGRNLAIGDRFSVLAHLYEVEQNDDGQITFSPPVRERAAAGTLVRLSEPHIDVRLASNDDWDVVSTLGVHSEPLTVNVVEAFAR